MATGALSSMRCRKCMDKLRARLVCHRRVWPQNAIETGRKCHYLVQLQSRCHVRLQRQNATNLLRLCSVRLRSKISSRALHATIGSSIGTNVSPGTAQLTVGATIFTATAGLTRGTNITLGHWKIDGWHSSHWKTSDWHRKDGSYHGCDDTWSKTLCG